ncbi:MULTISPECIES: flagellar basal body P-ring formation chaperone FlgA [Alteromonas]|jgi:flagellar basal body P-ring formation protein FlgA|uniref:Flagella basal body P-ring formation protein FlgA n=3 Tax=Alteromonas mediterranea TaxID=314275 RepID=S5AKU8_9ALTE|nr:MULTISPECIES: flagellar basal body P-ring formation chaperone FlgA [Alteromonas]AGP77278.1 flagellar basal body P-ring biosynthesis protein FlgA [Alteromonas mediterranea 615]MBR9783160.1 flagellar basal body P-ring formation protein FlgA [Gammaproteobacteria bacterium]AEA97280.2 flagellar basal body P-ring biosynthesis protein FlgA [Alteromonas mediterranea DE]AFV84526.1 flagellar basal body P-ring biosynthesis protein FlgA [Alteromonas mediterranea DE1]AGP96534.1 flagellar basal body P-ri
MKPNNATMHQSLTRLLLCVVLSVISISCLAAMTNHVRVEEGAKQYLLSQLTDNAQDTSIDVAIVKIDDRINIPDCPTGFQYNASQEALSQSYISVRVSCQNNEWYLFTSGQVTRTKEIVVTQGAVSPGTVLTSSNLTLAKVDVRRLRHTAFTDLEALIGARMKRRVTNGQAIQSNMLCFVCKGDRITITAEVAGMEVKTAGIAQQDGVVGDNIKVLNASSRKAVIARVASPEEVVIHL